MANLVYCNDNQLLKNNYYFALSTTPTCNPTQLPSSNTSFANSGASGFYFAPGVPVSKLNLQAPAMGVWVANGLPERSIASASLASAPSLPHAAMQGHVMPSFPHTLISLGPFANPGCQILLTKTVVSVIYPDGHTILKGWKEVDGPTCGASLSKPPSQVCPRQHCLTNMRTRAHAEVLRYFTGAYRHPNTVPTNGPLATPAQASSHGLHRPAPSQPRVQRRG
jgi:hypothetical protein